MMTNDMLFTDVTTLFEQYLSTESCATDAANAIRITAFKITVKNTAKNVRTNMQYYNRMLTVFQELTQKTTIEFYKDDKLDDTFEFTGTEEDIENELERFMLKVILTSKCWYSDSDGKESGTTGFCWTTCGNVNHHYSLIWKK